MPFSEDSVHGPWCYCSWLVVADYTMDGACGRGGLLIFPLLYKEREKKEGLGCQHLCQEHVSNDLISFYQGPTFSYLYNKLRTKPLTRGTLGHTQIQTASIPKWSDGTILRCTTYQGIHLGAKGNLCWGEGLLICS